MHIDQLRSQESFSAHLFLSLAVKCALHKLLYKIYALTYVSMKTYTTQVRFHSSLAAIYRAQHDTSSALSPVQGTMCCWLRAQMVCRCVSSRRLNNFLSFALGTTPLLLDKIWGQSGSGRQNRSAGPLGLISAALSISWSRRTRCTTQTLPGES